MSFLTFLLYFVVSHVVYTVVVTFLAIAYQRYSVKRQKRAIEQLLKSGQVQVVKLDDSGDDGQWH